jgi:TfoX/Sxy family transcriptional regulator of competence genes
VGEKGARLSGASEPFKDDVMARLEPLGGVTSRKMFGGFGIFHDGSM